MTTERHLIAMGALLAAAVLMAGCKTLPWLPTGMETNLPSIVTNIVASTDQQETKAEIKDEIDLSTVVWHGPDIRGWKIAADLKASVSGGRIYMETELLKGRAQTGDNGTTGNPWAIVKGSDGKWHAYTYEWIDYGRKHRDLWKAFDRGHGCPSVCVDSGTKGAEFYVAVSTVARGTYKQNGNERTPFRKVVHP